VSEEVDPVEIEVIPELVEVGGIVLELVGCGGIGAVDPTRAQLDERAVPVEAAEVVEELDGDSGSAGVTDERWAFPEPPVGERTSVRGREGSHENEV
jgi:hypothetical protein